MLTKIEKEYLDKYIESNLTFGLSDTHVKYVVLNPKDLNKDVKVTYGFTPRHRQEHWMQVSLGIAKKFFEAQKKQKEPPPLKCAYCGEIIERTSHNRMYCNSGCATRHRYTPRERTIFKKVCITCGGEFETKANNAKICQGCRNKKSTQSFYSGEKINCDMCGNDFVKKRYNQLRCSDVCKSEAKRLKQIEWSKKDHAEQVRKRR